MSQKVIVGITDCAKYPNYEKWILAEPDVEVIRLGYKQDNFDEIEKCDGILLTGGEDVHPKRFNRPELLTYCDREDMDDQRDEFELQVLHYTQENNVPLLGICRGLQIGNVFFGGSLIPDLPSFGKPDHSKNLGVDRYHSIRAITDSLLGKIAGKPEGEVNSAHHQSVDRIGEGLVVNALDGNGVIEGLERKQVDRKSFLLFVQWHPERMKDQNNVFARNVKIAFLDQVRKNK